MSIIAISGKIGSGKDTVGIIVQELCLGHNIDEIAYSIIHKIGTKEQREDSGWEIRKFAGKLKQIVSILTGIPVEDLEREEVKNQVLAEEWVRYAYAYGFTKDHNGNTTMLTVDCDKERYELELKTNWQTAYRIEYTPRLLLQRIGTEAMRDIIHSNIWVNALMSDYKPIGDNLLEGEVRKLNDEDLLYPNWIITDMRFPNEYKAVKDRDGITIKVIRPQAVFDGIGYNSGDHFSEVALDHVTDWDYVINNNGSIVDLIKKVKKILIKEQLIK